MKLLHTVAVTTCMVLSLTPSSFGVAQDFAVVNVNWTPNKFVAQRVAPGGKNIETALVNSLVKILESRPDDALKGIEAIIAENPNFRLAYLIKGDLLLARTRSISAFGNTGKVTPGVLEDMRQEAKMRFDRYLKSPPLDLAPQQILQMSPDQPYALVVDIARSRLYVYQNDRGEPHYLTDYYISSGKNGAEKLREGDQKTPIGVYEIDANVPKSMLTDFYGPGAFSLSYPNEWDRLVGRNGHGIWLHGTPSDTYSRPPRASNGCVVLSNLDLIDLAKYIRIGSTPVIVSNKAEWVPAEKWRIEKNKLLTSVETWRRDWESRDTDRYLSHYSVRFQADGMNIHAWSAQKRTVNASKTAVRIALSNVNMYAYPGVENMVVVSFDQDYRSNNLSTLMKKRQYWIHEGSRWRIVFEGAPNSPTTTVTAKR